MEVVRRRLEWRCGIAYCEFEWRMRRAICSLTRHRQVLDDRCTMKLASFYHKGRFCLEDGSER